MCVIAVVAASAAVLASPNAGAAAFDVSLTVAQVPQTEEQRTTLFAIVTVRRQEIVAGPYARYAQKYLGVSAPLADKVSHEITAAKIADISQLYYVPEPAISTKASHMAPEQGFPKLTVDKSSAVAMSLEESARLAAAKIFEIRQSRFDLISGEVGENVFGGGLGSALAEFNRLEEEYLSLFLGKQTSLVVEREFRLVPVRGRSTYTVCRFSEEDGLLPEDDLSGVPVVLELQPTEGLAMEAADSQVKPSSRATAVVVPADVRCRVIFDGAELASGVFPVWQFGRTVYVVQ
ncbi:MAG: DUF4831 family protein [Alistipes sp.]|nr:DUF4831 family protein [Alistipes sp.]